MKKQIAVIYHMFPHYRTAVLRELDRSSAYEFNFIASPRPYQGIEPMDPESVLSFEKAPFRELGPFLWQSSAIKAAVTRRYDGIIFLGNPNFISTWLAAALSRVTGKKVLFWTHGWLKQENRLKRAVRDTFYALSNKVLVYSDRAKMLGIASGFSENKIDVIYNSLDVDAADKVVHAIECASSAVQFNPKAFFEHKTRPLIVCSARLTAVCQFDLLLHAAAKLAQNGRPINILLIGDGPERERLGHLSKQLGVQVHFMGPCYDEKIVGPAIYFSDLTVSPGKVGLTSMHSLMYGTPVITHSDLDQQMPEVEAITPGRTGLLFERNNFDSLVIAIEEWLSRADQRDVTRRNCRETIYSKWNPVTQRRLIEHALDATMRNE